MDSPDEVPLTVAAKLSVPPISVLAVAGVTLTEIGGVTVTVASAVREESAALVAMTWKVPAVPGAVYLPDPSTEPPPDSRTVQRTDCDCPAVVPCTAAVNWSEPPARTVAVAGETVTEIWGITVTVALSEREGSATLVATT